MTVNTQKSPMLKPILLILFIFAFRYFAFTQCLVPPAPPDCNGTETLITNGDVITGGTSKWYYGPVATINSLTVNGGTLVVCGDLTIDKFYMTTGKVFIRPGGRLVIGSGIGAGLQFKGDCAIYNYGTCEIQRNLTLENNATAATPNIVANALGSSVFKMSNQYFVINNANSWFVNSGRAEFWGIITDPQSVAGSVCLGMSSTTTMAVLINKVANTYSAPSGNACVRVSQYSEFYGRLTSDPSLFACLGSGHTSNSGCIPFGCAPNNWGSAQVFTNCAGCAALGVLGIHFSSFIAKLENNHTVYLQWQMNAVAREGKVIMLRSANGIDFIAIDSLPIRDNENSNFNLVDKHPLPGNNYYMIQYTNPQTGKTENSKMVKVYSEATNSFNFYPVPFDEQLFIDFAQGVLPEKILLTDLTGRNIRTTYTMKESNTARLTVLDKLQPGLYIIHIQTNKNIMARTIFKR